MKIVVVTRGRPETQPTATNLRAAGLPFTYVFTSGDETIPRYDSTGPTTELSCENIAQKRGLVLSLFGAGGELADPDGKFLMLDDDLDLWLVGESGETVVGGPETWRAAVALTEELTDQFAHVSMAERFHIQRRARPYERNCRARCWAGWGTSLLGERSAWPIYDRISTLEDIDVVLQLFSLGHETATITKFALKEKSYAPGGCSLHRTRRGEWENHEKLRALWPDYVSLRPVTSRAGVGCVVQFQKAARELIPTSRTRP